MSDNLYAYAVARIRAKEMSLFGKQTIEQLMACHGYEESLRFLYEKGWGKTGNESGDEILSTEREKTWELIEELVDDMSVFDTFLYENDFHNLKAAIKEISTDKKIPDIYITHGTCNPAEIVSAIREHDFSKLPSFLQEIAKQAYEIQTSSGDSQLCDVVIDKAALDTVYNKAKYSGSQLLKDYAEIKVATADIKIALRNAKNKKSKTLLSLALVECESLDIQKLAQASLEGEDEVINYLSFTSYSDAIIAIKSGYSAFEKWCDDLLMEKIKEQKYNSFTISPIAAYLLARENEIKTVRIVLSGKRNGLCEDMIRERLRNMYV